MTSVLRDWTFAVLWVFVLTIPWEAVVQLPSIGTLSRGVGLFAIPIALVAVAVGGRRHRLHDSHLIMVGLTAWTVASIAWSVRPSVTLQLAGTMLQLLAMVLLLWEFGRDGRRHRQLLWAFVLGAMLGALAILPTAFGHDAVTTTEIRFTEGGLNENQAAFVFSMAIPVAWHLSLTSVSSLSRWAAGLYVPAGAVAAVLTGSRGGVLTLILGLSIVPLSMRRGGLRTKALALVVLATATVVVANFAPAQTIDRLRTIPTELTTGDLGSRERLWEVSWAVIGSEPVTGVGAGASRFRIEPIIGVAQAPHNTYLSLAADLGVVGLGLFLLLLMSVGGRWLRLRGREQQLVGVLLVTLVVGLLPGHREYVKVTWLIVAIMLAEATRFRSAEGHGLVTVHNRLVSHARSMAADHLGTSPASMKRGRVCV